MSATIPVPADDDHNALTIFQALGYDIRFGVTDDDRVYAVAADFATAMGYRDAANATRLLEEDEKGTQIVSTLGGDQQVSVIYEDGMWELVFRSSLPGAKVLKKRVKEILREIRRTGRFEADERTRGYEIMTGEGVTYSVREAGNILNNDPDILIGQNTLFGLLRDMGMLDGKERIYAKHNRHLTLRTGRIITDLNGDVRVGGSQVRVTPQGLKYLHKRLRKIALS